jgi:hypothetical protein
LAFATALPVAEQTETLTSVRHSADTVSGMDWDAIDAERLFDGIRLRGPTADAERSVWAFERALVAARIDGTLLRHLLVACVCLVAHEEGETPRTILERVFRRAVSDREWREEYASLFD